MVVRMRLARFGHTHRPYYRITIADARRHVTKKFIEHIGTYDPLADKLGVKHVRLNIPRVKYWLSVGCQPTPTVLRLLSHFQLVPRPPIRRDVPVDIDIIRGMNGLGITSTPPVYYSKGRPRQISAEDVFPRDVAAARKLVRRLNENKPEMELSSDADFASPEELETMNARQQLLDDAIEAVMAEADWPTFPEDEKGGTLLADKVLAQKKVQESESGALSDEVRSLVSSPSFLSPPQQQSTSPYDEMTSSQDPYVPPNVVLKTKSGRTLPFSFLPTQSVVSTWQNIRKKCQRTATAEQSTTSPSTPNAESV